MLYFKFDIKKAIAAITYVANNLIKENIKADFHKVFKILYFADQKHLLNYGRPIVGDHYIAMKDGPVPSRIYDILKIIRGDSIFSDDKGFSDKIAISGNHYILPRINSNIENFSESNLECIDKSIQENKRLSFKELKIKSHDAAYNKATKDDKISYRNMAKVLGASKEMISYMRELSENEKLFAE